MLRVIVLLILITANIFFKNYFY